MVTDKNLLQKRRKTILTISFTIYFLIFAFIYILKSDKVSANNLTIQSIVSETNFVRAQHNLPPLKLNLDLTSGAYLKAYNMIEEQYWDHNSPSGKTPWTFIQKTGYNFRFAGENLAKNFTSSDELVNAWMHSQDHRANILNPNYEDIGVAILKGSLNGDNVTFIVVFYGTTYNDSIKNNTSTTDKITITYPIDQSIINDPFVSVMGTVCCFDKNTGFTVSDNGLSIGEIKPNNNKWTFRVNKQLLDGVHHLTVFNTEDPQYMAETTFKLDSTPPSLNADTISIKKTLLGYNISIVGDSDISQVSVLLNDHLFYANKKENNNFFLTIPFVPDVKQAMIIASDNNNNISNYNISNSIKPVQSKFEILIGRIALSSHSPAVIYLIAMVSVLLLFVLDIFLYRKFKLVKYFGQDLLSIFIIIMAFNVNILYQFIGTVL